MNKNKNKKWKMKNVISGLRCLPQRAGQRDVRQVERDPRNHRQRSGWPGEHKFLFETSHF